MRSEPCITAGWPGCQIDCRYGNSVYHVNVKNPEGATDAVRQLILDGMVLAEGKTPLIDDGAACTVRARPRLTCR